MTVKASHKLFDLYVPSFKTGENLSYAFQELYQIVKSTAALGLNFAKGCAYEAIVQLSMYLFS